MKTDRREKILPSFPDSEGKAVALRAADSCSLTPPDRLLKAYASFTCGGSVSYLTHTPVPGSHTGAFLYFICQLFCSF